MEDDLAEGPEPLTVTFTFTSTPPDGVGFSKATATATINDNNALAASVSGPVTVPEGYPAVFTVYLDGGVGTANVVVEYEVGGTAVEGVDYEVPSGKLIIEVDSDNRTPNSKTIEINTKAVADDAAGETLTLRLTNATTSKGTATVGTPSEVTTTTTHEDTVTVSVAAADGAVHEGDSVAFTVTLTGGDNSGPVVVNYRVGGDVTEDDYKEAQTGTVNFPANADPRTRAITLEAVEDSLDEPAETLTVTLSLPANTDDVILGTPSASATITDGDSLTVAVTADQETVNEGDLATFTVRLTGATSTADVVVSYRVGGDEVTADDYEGSAARTLTIPARDSSATIEIQTANDSQPETDEDLTVTLIGAVTDGRMVDPDPANTPEENSITILANDGEIVVSVTDAGTVAEGADAVFTVSFSGTVTGTVKVQFDTDPSATAKDDPANERDFTTTSRPLMFTSGKTSATVVVPTTQDDRAEDNETFAGILTEVLGENLPPGVNIGTERATATIRDDDPLRVSVTADQRTMLPASESAAFTVRLTKANGTEGRGSESVTVSYTVDGEPGTQNIQPLESTAPISVIKPSDGWDDSVVVILTGVSTSHGRVTLGTRDDAKTTIADPDTTVGFNPATVSVAEGMDATFTVSRMSTTFTGDVKVRYTTEYGSATSADFTAVSGILTIPYNLPINERRSITVKTRPDDLAEKAETFTVRLESITEPIDSAVAAIGTDRATATIPIDDNLNASITSEQASVLEGSPAKFTVTLTRTGGGSGAGSEDIVVNYVVDPGSVAKAADGDFTAPSERLTIRAGQTSGTITIDAKDDGVLEVDGELLKLMLTGKPSTAAGDVVLGTTTAEATIRDLNGTLLVSLADAGTVTEGRPAVFNLTLSGKYSEALTASFTTSPTGYTAPQPLIIPAGETTGSVTVATIDDREAEDDETLTLNLTTLNLTLAEPNDSAVPDYVTLVNTSATATITDNDPLTAVLSGPVGGVGEVKMRGSR